MDVRVGDREALEPRVKLVLIAALELELEPAMLGSEDVIFDGALDVDSIAALEIVTRVEDEFGILFEDEEVSDEMFTTVGALVSAVSKKLENGGGEPRSVSGVEVAAASSPGTSLPRAHPPVARE